MASQELASRPTCDSTLKRDFSQVSNTCDPQSLYKPVCEGLIYTCNSTEKFKQWSYRQQWPSTPECTWKRRSRQLTWWKLLWTISSRNFSCNQAWSGKAEWWWAETEPRGSVSGRSPARQTHFYALFGCKKTNMLMIRFVSHHQGSCSWKTVHVCH